MAAGEGCSRSSLATGQWATVVSAATASAAIVSFGTDAFLATTVQRRTSLVRVQTNGFDLVPAFAPTFVHVPPTLAVAA